MQSCRQIARLQLHARHLDSTHFFRGLSRQEAILLASQGSKEGSVDPCTSQQHGSIGARLARCSVSNAAFIEVEDELSCLSIRLPLLLANISLRSAAQVHYMIVTPAVRNDVQDAAAAALEQRSFVLMVDVASNDLCRLHETLSSCGAILPAPSKPAKLAARKIGEGSTSRILLLEQKSDDPLAKYADMSWKDCPGSAPDAEHYVLKFFKHRRQKAWPTLCREVSALSSLPQHPNVIKLLGVLQYDDAEKARSSYYALKLPYYGCGSLLDSVSRGAISEGKARRISQHMLSAVAHLHAHRVLHRDVNAQNILVNCKDEHVLADFGLACSMDETEELSRRCGAPGFCAPEAIQPDGTICEQSDVFGVGAVCYFALSARPPFQGSDRDTTLRATLHGDVVFNDALMQRASASCRAFILLLLRRDPSKRPAASAAQQEPWLQSEAGAVHCQVPSLPHTSSAAVDTQDSLPPLTMETRGAFDEEAEPLGGFSARMPRGRPACKRQLGSRACDEGLGDASTAIKLEAPVFTRSGACHAHALEQAGPQTTSSSRYGSLADLETSASALTWCGLEPQDQEADPQPPSSARPGRPLPRLLKLSSR
eukprot:TRINITY_DN91357_c0_g1_i1.p1 TRINITY_DN91357_c0_g1~~TRINITY_DN91357_c0_g1_i1.p1  ORF type:complete len:597 (+),score=81.36 TRINITY_DN91357_c0_g1_i1:142-1932(+)